MPSYYSQGNWTWRALLWLISPRQLWKGEERVRMQQQRQGKFPWFGSNFLFLLKKENPSLLLGFIWCGALVLSFQKSFLLKVPLLGPPYHFSLESSSGLLSLERSASAGRSVVPPQKKQKTKKRDTFPLLSKIQNLLTKHNQILHGTEVITPKQRAHETINIL